MGQELGVKLSVSGAVETVMGQAPRTARVSGDSVVISGNISTPNPCYKVEASMSNGPTLTLTATAQPGFCAQVIGNFAYEATINGLPSGNHTVGIVYTYPSTGWDDKRHEVRVEVP